MSISIKENKDFYEGDYMSDGLITRQELSQDLNAMSLDGYTEIDASYHIAYI